MRLAITLFILFSSVSCYSKKVQQLEIENQLLRQDIDSMHTRIVQLEQDLVKKEEQKFEAEQAARISSSLKELSEKLKKEVEKGSVQIDKLKSILVVSVAEELFFESGSAEILESGKEALKKIADALSSHPGKVIRVEGHTDNVPIGESLKEIYANNWDLAATRAVNVVAFLQEHAGVSPGRLSAISYGQYRPKAKNSNLRGRKKNRRIEIVLADREIDQLQKIKDDLAKD